MSSNKEIAIYLHEASLEAFQLIIYSKRTETET